MAKKNVGSIRKVTLDGVTFDAFASANIKTTPSQYTNDAVATSGENLRKLTKRPVVKESIDLKADAQELEFLQELADREDDFPMSYTNASGDVYRAVGWIDLESHESEEAKATIKMFSRGNTWNVFVNA